MIRLLLVDDEPAIVDGLLQNFQEAFPELDICKAYSADEALDIARKTKIDLIISDISMPGKNGLQLVEEISVYWPSCRIILLTGHSEFEYVYTAIRQNVDNYILKTEGIEPIVAAVKTAVDRFAEENGRREMLEQAIRQMTAAEPLLRKEFYEALLYGERAADIAGERHFAGLAVRLDRDRPLLLVVGKADAWEDKTSYTKKMDIFHSIRDLFAHQLSAQLLEEGIVHDHTELVWFVQPALNSKTFAAANGDTDWRGIVTYLKGMLENVQNGCRDMLGVQVSFAVCRSAVDWNEIGREFELLKAALKQSAFFGQAMAVLDLGMPEGLYNWGGVKPVGEQTPDFNKTVTALQKHMQSGDGESAIKLTEEMFGRLKSDLSGRYMLGLERYYTLLLAVVSLVNDGVDHEKTNGGIRIASMSIMELPGDWEAAERQFIKLVKSICQNKKEQIAKGENLLCERIHRYIHDNMGGDLSLARIAEAVFFNPSYLSRYYKQLTGRNLSDYINVVKTEAAVDMLAHTQLKVSEIALRLGFESPSYFTAFFRKMKQSSPQEFRDAQLHRK